MTILNGSITRERQSQEWILTRVGFTVLGANLAFIAAAWWTSSGFEMTRSSADFLNGLGRITGLEGTFLVLVQLLLMARIPILQTAFGLERLATFHRLNGWVSMEMIAAHAVFQTLGYMLESGRGPVAQLGTFATRYEGLLGAMVGLVLMLAVVASSIAIARLRLRYETWYFVHLYAYVGIALAFSHQLQTGADFAGNAVFTRYWVALYVLVAATILRWRVAGPLFNFRRYRFRVEAVTSEAPSVTSIRVKGRDLDSLRVAPGQFFIWRFLDGSRWWQAHPFSVSGRGAGGSLRMTVRQVGDFTSALHEVRADTPVILEGPFGSFTPAPGSRRKTLLVAGGVGVTPIRALAQAMVEERFDVCVLYRAHRERDVLFRQEFAELAKEGTFKIQYLVSGTSPAAAGRRWFSQESLTGMVPDLRERAAFICGPPEMTREVVSSLRAVGIGSDQIRTESFRY